MYQILLDVVEAQDVIRELAASDPEVTVVPTGVYIAGGNPELRLTAHRWQALVIALCHMIAPGEAFNSIELEELIPLIKIVDEDEVDPEMRRTLAGE